MQKTDHCGWVGVGGSRRGHLWSWRERKKNRTKLKIRFLLLLALGYLASPVETPFRWLSLLWFHKNFSGLLFLLPSCFPRWGNLAVLSIRKLASFWTRKKKADIRSSLPAAPRTAKKWSSGATPPATDREPRLARPNADGATARPRGGGGGRDARGRGNRRWRRRGGEAAIRSAETRRRCGRGRLASGSHRRPLRPRPPPTARWDETTLAAIHLLSWSLGLKRKKSPSSKIFKK